MHKGLIFH